MAQLSDIVRKHVDALSAEAAQNKFPSADLARTLLSFTIQIWRESRSPEEIAEELKFVLDNLDPDQEYTFMRP